MTQGLPEIDSDAYAVFNIPNLTGTPERRLLLAIVERSILDLVGNDTRESENAAGWLFDDDDDSGSHFSFAWICQELDLDLCDIREKIKNMPKRGESRIAPWYMTRAC